jgi:hypothetical protein
MARDMWRAYLAKRNDKSMNKESFKRIGWAPSTIGKVANYFHEGKLTN